MEADRKGRVGDNPLQKIRNYDRLCRMSNLSLWRAKSAAADLVVLCRHRKSFEKNFWSVCPV